jgi:ABC-type transport system substrate-binding protein
MAVLLLASGCTPASRVERTPLASPVPRGGTLRIVIPTSGPSFFASPDNPQEAIDPGTFNWYDSAEVFRCCLARTLYSYVGRPTKDGGAILRPDVAAALADVSGDGLTWTIRLKAGLHYGPPLQAVEITAGDFVRGIQRSLRVEQGNLSVFGVIRGAAEFAQGKADSIAGLEVLDAHTLRISLTEPQGDLGARLALSQAAPIPPNPSSPAARFGVADGHDHDFGRFVVSSGPYMVEGSENLEFSKPVTAQTPLSGFMPGHSLTLVRNPSWQTSTDPLRPAYADRIEITISGTLQEASGLVDSGQVDFVLFSGIPPQAPADQVQRFRSDPKLSSYVFIDSRDFVRSIVMNVAVPPFDDVHVRRAVNYVIDKQGVQELAGGSLVAQIAGHIVIDSLENNLLLNYAPYATASRTDAVMKARSEMQQSKYAHDTEGRCTAKVCQGVVAETFVPGVATGANRTAEIKEAALIKSNLQEIGIDIVVNVVPSQMAFDDLDNPKSKLPLHLRVGFGKDYLSAANVILANFYGPSLTDQQSNGSLVGATPEQLRRWGYTVKSVPNVDDRIQACLAAVGDAQFQCWAGLDQYMMEEVVPWVPYFFESYVRTVGPRVVRYSFAQFTTEPALDQIALQAGA